MSMEKWNSISRINSTRLGKESSCYILFHKIQKNEDEVNVIKNRNSSKISFSFQLNKKRLENLKLNKQLLWNVQPREFFLAFSLSLFPKHLIIIIPNFVNYASFNL